VEVVLLPDLAKNVEAKMKIIKAPEEVFEQAV